MTQSITASDLIRRSLITIGAIAAGEPLRTSDANDMLLTLNEMLDSWSTEELTVYGQVNETLDVQSGKNVYTWGTGGDWTTTRPIRIRNMTCVFSDESFPMREMTQLQYDNILDKDINQPILERWLFTNSYPLGVVTIYPTPSETVQISAAVDRVLTNIPNLQTVIHLPPGYLRALRYCLAVDAWPDYPNPQTDINSIKALAIKSKANIKIANQTEVLVSFSDVPGVGDYGNTEEWRTG